MSFIVQQVENFEIVQRSKPCSSKNVMTFTRPKVYIRIFDLSEVVSCFEGDSLITQIYFNLERH